MRKLLSILLIIMIIITFIQIRNVYALYKDQLSGDYATEVGGWHIKVNGKDIVSPGTTVEFEMSGENIGYKEGEDMSTGASAIAPDTDAFFDILIDSTNTDVPVKYIIGIEKVNSYNVYNIEDPDRPVLEETVSFPEGVEFEFKVTEVLNTFGSYTYTETGVITGAETTTDYSSYLKTKVDEDNNEVIGVIPLKSIQDGNKDKVSVVFRWMVEDEELTEEEKTLYKQMYNEMLDKNTSTESVKLIVPVTVKAIQYLGEEL